jgi:hypothetical protein
VSEHLHRSNVPDSERVASWAAQALNEGRYQLGHTLARIAEQAERIELATTASSPPSPPPVLRSVPTPGAGLTEYMPKLQPPATYQQLAHLGEEPPAVNAATVAPIVAEAAGHIYRNTGQPEAPAPRRCAANVGSAGMTEPCRGVIHWSLENHTWIHLHDDIEADHVPVLQ